MSLNIAQTIHLEIRLFQKLGVRMTQIFLTESELYKLLGENGRYVGPEMVHVFEGIQITIIKERALGRYI